MTTHGVPHWGSEMRCQYLTEIEAAYGRDAGKRRLFEPRNTALDEAQRLRELIAKFRSALARKAKHANRPGVHWAPTLEDCKAVQAITTAAERAVAMEERLRRLIEREREGYTEAQLEAVWQASLRRSALSMGAEDWWDLLRIGFGDDVARVLIRLRFGEDELATVEGS